MLGWIYDPKNTQSLELHFRALLAENSVLALFNGEDPEWLGEEALSQGLRAPRAARSPQRAVLTRSPRRRT